MLSRCVGLSSLLGCRSRLTEIPLPRSSPNSAPPCLPPSLPPRSQQPSRADTLLAAFTSFRAELDAHHAQRERIVKLSRDVTALSKQLIFTLHRVGSGKGKRAVFDEAEAKMDGLRRLFDKLQGEVRGADFWRSVDLASDAFRALTSPGAASRAGHLVLHVRPGR